MTAASTNQGTALLTRLVLPASEPDVTVRACLRRSTATWPLDPSKDEKQGWRHIRIRQMGKNASGQTHYLSLSGLELYGTVSAVCEDQLGKNAA